MFGYIRPSKPRLSEQDEARFQSVYCGLCHELGRKYGFSARFVLNFDFTFLAILLSGAQEAECESCRCAAQTPALAGFLQAFDPTRRGSRPLVLPLLHRIFFPFSRGFSTS